MQVTQQPISRGARSASCLLTVIVPVYNEEQVVGVFWRRIQPILDGLQCSWELLFIDDGSVDATVERVLELRSNDPRVKLIEFARNFGKEAALTAGFDYAQGDSVIPVDVDLQDPPELIPEMVELWLRGYDVVIATRRPRTTDSRAKRLSAAAFYWVFNKLSSRPIPENTGDFRLLDRRAVEAVRLFRERNRFMKGILAHVGFRETQLYFDRAQRVGGSTKWKPWSLFTLAIEGITSFSTVPLRIWSLLGALIASGALVFALWEVILVLLYGRVVPGHASVLVAVLVLGGLNMISIGILGEYVGRLYLETKQRPLYLIRDRHLDDENPSGQGTSP